MSTATLTPPGPPEPAPTVVHDAPTDHRGSWLPNGAMIATRLMELRRRRGLMVALILVNIGIPVVFLAVRLVAHAVAPHSYGPAGGYNVFSTMVAGVLFVFGFIVAATVGCTAGSVDLTEGMFRHLVVTGRSRLALYLARIPAGLAIIVPLVAAGFAVVCLVCSLAAPTQLDYDGVHVPPGLSRAAFDSWATGHADEVVCNFNLNVGPNDPNASTITDVLDNVPCGNHPGGPAKVGPGVPAQSPPTQAQIETVARLMADQSYADYSVRFLSPSISLMIRSGLWIELYAAVGFLVGLGLSSLMGQRTVPVIVLIVLEIVLTPVLSHPNIPHLVNLQRGLIGVAASHLEPAGLPSIFGGSQGGGSTQLPESLTVAVCVMVGWVVAWTALGAWRMATRDA